MFTTTLRDYRGKVEALGSVTERTDTTTAITETVIARIQWGHASEYIELKIERVYAAGDSTGSWVVTLDPTYGSPVTLTGSVWEDVSVTWEMDDSKLSAKKSSHPATWEMSEMRVYVNTVLWQTLSSHTDSAFTYNLTLDRYSCGGWKFSTLNREIVTCSTPDDYWLLANLFPEYGYERKVGASWTDDPLNLTIFPYPDPSCECQEAFPVLTWVRTARCVGRHWVETHIVVPEAHEVTCHCPEGYTETLPEIDEIHYPTELDRDFGYWIHMTPSNSGLNAWSAESASECYGLLDTPPGETVISDSGIDPRARCAYEFEIDRVEKSLFCQDRIQEMLCILEPPGAPTAMDPCVDNDDSGCIFHARSSLVLDGPCADSTKEPFCFAFTPMHWFEEVYNCDGDIIFAHWKKPIPTGDIEYMSKVVTGGNNSHPRLFADQFARRYCVYARNASGTLSTLLKTSDDDGRTWRTEETTFTMAKYPDGMYDEAYRFTLLAAFKYVSGSSGPGNIWVQVKPPNSATFGSEYTVKDETGTPLVVADTSFKFTAPPAPSAPWVLVCVIDGETERSYWMSVDFGVSWRRYF